MDELTFITLHDAIDHHDIHVQFPAIRSMEETANDQGIRATHIQLCQPNDAHFFVAETPNEILIMMSRFTVRVHGNDDGIQYDLDGARRS